MTHQLMSPRYSTREYVVEQIGGLLRLKDTQARSERQIKDAITRWLQRFARNQGAVLGRCEVQILIDPYDPWSGKRERMVGAKGLACLDVHTDDLDRVRVVLDAPRDRPLHLVRVPVFDAEPIRPWSAD